jgi:tRNA/rRNA methyltransferase
MCASIILVEPGESRNIGSVARAMSNFGATSLSVVSPRNYDPERALQTACGGDSVLQAAEFHTSLPDALTKAQYVVGFSAVRGKTRLHHISLIEWAGTILNKQSVPRDTALVFGPEDSGLRYEHIELCSQLVFIPTSNTNSSLNLSHAVSVVLYELFSKELLQIGPDGREPDGADPTTPEYTEQASSEHFSRAEYLLDEIAYRCGFYHVGTSHKIPLLIRQMLRRNPMKRREMAILLGLLSRITKALAGKIPISPLPPSESERIPGTLGKRRGRIRGQVPQQPLCKT